MALAQTQPYPGKSADLNSLGDGLNFGTPLAQVGGTLVSNALFFLRSNNPPPDLKPHEWRLRIDGRVRTPLEGNQWDDEAVSNAVFTGIPLRVLLERAGVENDAVEVVATGADADSFQRAMPLDIALRPDVLLAWQMNGEPIPPPNGGPVRMIVPGWAGIASVKWPVHIEVVNTPFQGYWNVERYIMVDANGRTLRSVREMPVKSVIAWPGNGQVVSPGSHTVHGFAWSGFGRIERVDVSADAWRTSAPARLLRGDGPLAWARWEYTWSASNGDSVKLSVRATDSAGNVQPEHAEWNKFGYQMNAIVTHEVSVQA